MYISIDTLYGIYKPYSTAAKILYTHLYTTSNEIYGFSIYYIRRTISMCQAFGQRSFRAIIKLN